MDGEEAERETPTKAAERRRDFAVEAIKGAILQKLGNPKSHGTFTIKLHWNAGRLERVTVEDSVSYK